ITTHWFYQSTHRHATGPSAGLVWRRNSREESGARLRSRPPENWELPNRRLIHLDAGNTASPHVSRIGSHGNRCFLRFVDPDWLGCAQPLPVDSRPMDPLLKLLHENATLKPNQLAGMLNLSEADVAAKIRGYEAEHVILGYRAVLNEEK